MRAAVMQGLHKPLAIETLPDPRPAKASLVVKVGRCGICGSDLHMTEDAGYGMKAGDVLGHEFAGGRGARQGCRRRQGHLAISSPSIPAQELPGRCAACMAGRRTLVRRSACRAAASAEVPSPASTSASIRRSR